MTFSITADQQQVIIECLQSILGYESQAVKVLVARHGWIIENFDFTDPDTLPKVTTLPQDSPTLALILASHN